MLMTKKELYTSPEVDVFELRVEGVICQSFGGDSGAGIDDAITDDWGDMFGLPTPPLFPF